MNNNDIESSNRRKFIRVKFSQRVLCNTVINPGDQNPTKLITSYILTATNISLGGLAMLCYDLIVPDTILFFILDIDTIPYDVVGRVIYCIPTEDLFQVGVEFESLSPQLEDHIKRFVARQSLSGL